MPQLRYTITLFQCKMMCHRWDSIPKEKLVRPLPLERPSDVFSYTSFRGSFFEPRLHLRFETAPAEGSRPAAFEFTPEEIERLAEMEHGRFNAERLLDGWRYGSPKDVARKISPYLVPWAELPEDVKKWDCDAVKEIPALLTMVGMQICRG
jgi:hypothetical protein